MNQWKTHFGNLIKHPELYDLINAEGTILGLLTGENGQELFLQGFLDDGSGHVCFKTDRESLQKYLEGDLTLRELAERSPSETFALQQRSGSVREITKAMAMENPVTTWNSRYKENPRGMVIEQAADKFRKESPQPYPASSEQIG